MTSTRDAVLEALKAAGRATVNQLAEKVGVKAVTVRHHLNVLLADGLVAIEERRQPVGRPIHVYYLTEKAENLFPQRYRALVERLLDQLKGQLPPEVFRQIIADLAMAIARDLQKELENLPPHERRERLIEVLAQEGFMAEWRHNGDTIELVEYHCPYYHVGQRHPEVCQIDETLIRIVVGTDVEKDKCLLTGDQVCTFVLADEENTVS